MTTKAEKDVPKKPSDKRETPHESVDLARRPGPGERGDQEKPGSPLNAEEQGGGRSLEEESLIQSDEDDAGGLPNQREANVGPQKPPARRMRR